MNQAHSLAQVVAYQLGELEGADRDEFEAHIVECSECLREFVAVKRAAETAEGEPRPPLALAARVRRDTMGEPAKWERPVAWLVALAGAALIIILVGTLGHQQSLPPGVLERLEAKPARN